VSIEFFIAYQIQPKQGDRSRIIGSKGKSFVQHYQPAKVRNNARDLALLMAPHRPATPLEGPLRMELTFQWSWPKSMSKRKRARGLVYRETKPDCENLLKQLNDVMERSGFFRNDAQIADLHVRKVWTDSPGVQVTLSRLEETNG
jgi:crossover junction endodeoxyribonuclease RusA